MLGDLCFGCDVRFGALGALVQLDSVNCSICYTKGVKGTRHIKCDHEVCVDCFKKAYCDDMLAKPVFPYGQTAEYEYLEDRSDERWSGDPNILKYEADYETWLQIVEETMKKNEVLRRCKECGL